jgi:hypothetical protein
LETYGVVACWRGPLQLLEVSVVLVGPMPQLYVLLLRSSTVEIAASPPAVRPWPELAFQLHQAPDPGAVGTEVGLDVGGRRAGGSQVDAKQLRTPLQRRRDRPVQIRVVPGPHPTRLSNACSIIYRQRCVVRRDRSEPGWAAPGPQLGGTWGQQGINEPRGQRSIWSDELGRKPARVSFHTAAIGSCDAVSSSQSYCGGGV